LSKSASAQPPSLLLRYSILEEIFKDDYFPKFLAEGGKLILAQLYEKIECQDIQSLDALYNLTRAATVKFNALIDEFEENHVGIEPSVRDCISKDFDYIADSYGFVLTRKNVERKW
jgi:hypothetical protein